MRGIEVGGLGALIYLWLIANSRPTWATYLRICLKNNFKKLVITILTVVRWNLIIALVHFTHFHVFFGHLYIFFWWFVQCKFYCLIFFVSLLKIIFICSVYWFSVRCISCIDFLYFDSSLFTAMTLCYFIRSYLPFFFLCVLCFGVPSRRSFHCICRDFDPPHFPLVVSDLTLRYSIHLC